MILAKLRYLHSPDIHDLTSYQPKQPNDFGFLVQAMIGPSTSPGEESFDFLVCSSKWLGANLRNRSHLFGRHYLFLEEYDYDVLYNAISNLCSNTSGATWQEVAAKLSRFGKWEFEDYHP